MLTGYERLKRWRILHPEEAAAQRKRSELRKAARLSIDNPDEFAAVVNLIEAERSRKAADLEGEPLHGVELPQQRNEQRDEQRDAAGNAARSED